MAILVECVCGAKFEAGAELAGGTMDCTKCKRELKVPAAEWDAKYRKEAAKLESPNEPERVAAIKAIRALGTPNILPALMRGVYDPARPVVNQALAGLLSAGDWSRAQLMQFMAQGALKPARLVAMVREEKYREGPAIICDMIDAGKFNENQISELITLLGEADDQRCISTLKALRHAYPNLAMLIDNALAAYKKFDSQVNKIPEDAKRVDDESAQRVTEMAASQRAAPKKGCLGLLLLLLAPAVAAGCVLAYRAMTL